MRNTIIIVTAVALVAVSGVAAAMDAKPASGSFISIDGLPADAYTSASIVAYGEPPKPEEQVKRRHAVGFVPKIPPLPGSVVEEPVAQDAVEMTPVDEAEEAASGEKTASIDDGADADEAEAGDMELRLE